MLNNKDRSAFREQKRWISAQRLHNDAMARGEHFPILIADASNTENLLACGLITRLQVGSAGTLVSLSDIRPIAGHCTQELILRSKNQPIAAGFIRPYAIVHTPQFIPHLSKNHVFVHRSGLAYPEFSAFTYGYWDSGNGTDRLIAAIDEAERARGFEPPHWVDIRISRAVRALGFRQDALERLVGKRRYTHIPDLGNVFAKTTQPGIQIKNPRAVDGLLDLILENQRRRVIFFCACDPITSSCHRFKVRGMLLKKAAIRGVRLLVEEWPGGGPWHVAFDVPDSRYLQRKQIPLPAGFPEAMAAAIPWDSRLTMRVTGYQAIEVRVGPARFGRSETWLPLLETPGSGLKTLQRLLGNLQVR